MGVQVRKSRSLEKVVGFSLASLFKTRKQAAITQGGTRGIGYTRRGGKSREAVTSKAERTSEIADPFQINSHKTRITQAWDP